MAGRWRSILALCLLTSCVVPIFSAPAAETVAYSYDARGRLVKVGHSGTVNNNLTACYSYDGADNRSNVVVATSSDCALPSFSINSASATEGSPVVFTVTKSGTATGTLTVDYATAGGTATSGSDFTATSGTLTFLDTDTAKTISVPTTNDTTYESSESFTVTLSNASAGSTISAPQGTGTINDNDSPPPSFAIGNASVTEGGNLVLTVTKTGSTSTSFSVNYATANGTATAGSDYTATSGTLTFTSAQTSKTITITTTDDAVAESAETVLVNLSGATGGATITDAQGVGTINDNDVSFSINSASATEGSSVVFTVTKTGSTSSTLSVNYATANGTAIAPGDYTATSGTLTFGPTVTTATIGVNTNSVDPKYEPDETFYVNLSGATGGATIAGGQGEGTIYDAWGSLSLVPGEETEGVIEAAPQQSPETSTSDPPPDGSAGEATASDGAASVPQGGQ